MATNTTGAPASSSAATCRQTDKPDRDGTHSAALRIPDLATLHRHRRPQLGAQFRLHQVADSTTTDAARVSIEGHIGPFYWAHNYSARRLANSAHLDPTEFAAIWAHMRRGHRTGELRELPPPSDAFTHWLDEQLLLQPQASA